MSKRQSELNTATSSKRIDSVDCEITSNYTGFSPSEKVSNVDEIEIPESTQEIESFYQNFVLARKPCKIKGVLLEDVFLKGLKPANISSLLPSEEILQIEQKVNGGFGSGEKKLGMTFAEFMHRLNGGESNLYLTTQYAGAADDYMDQEADSEEEDSEEEDGLDTAFEGAGDISGAESINFSDAHDDFEDLESQNEESTTDSVEGQDAVAELSTGPLTSAEAEQRVKELYQPPMDNLLRAIPPNPAFLHKFIPQQINLWIGATAGDPSADQFLKGFNPEDPKLGLGRSIPGGGSSSGLHHDYADNIYIPVSGRKRFTLFSPRDAGKMYTVGTIRTVFNSGVIDYARCETAPLWRTLRADGAIIAEVAKHELEFNNDLSKADRERLEKIVQEDEECRFDYKGKLDPPSFSAVIPSAVHLDKIENQALRAKITASAKEKWPLFFEANRMVVDLKPGEMLYLPTGWFHEVTSFGSDYAASIADRIHIAANYWFTPPDGETQDNLYPSKDQYWLKDYERTAAALAFARNAGLVDPEGKGSANK